MYVKIERAILSGGLLAVALLTGEGRAEGNAAYSLAAPDLPTVRLSGDNAWSAANAVLPVAASYANVLVATGAKTNVVLAASEAGGVSECAKPNYWLGDEITWPVANVDPDATYQKWKEDRPEGFVVDKNGRVFVTAGGVRQFVWQVKEGTAVKPETIVYRLATTAKDRPKRLFWTEPPFNSPAVSLSGTFPVLYGPDDLLKGVYTVTTNFTDETRKVISTVVTNVLSGVVLDPVTLTLTTRGQPSGQFVLAYFESGSHNILHHLQVVEVRRPEVIVQKGEIGEQMEPDGGGYTGKEALEGFPTVALDEDVLGPFYYQHKTDNPSAEKEGWVFPIRVSTNRWWSTEIWWKERDIMNVQWPFECDQYACSWPDNPPVHVRRAGDEGPGLPIWIPDDYLPTMHKYREPVLFDIKLDNRKFTTPGAGMSLVRLEQDDDVWFLPLKSVLRTDARYFNFNNASNEVEWCVGSRIVYRPSDKTGLAGDLGAEINGAIPGYVNRAKDLGNAYDVAIYRERESIDWPKGVHGLDSVIYPVNAPQGAAAGKPIEVWWSTEWSREEMSVPIEIPALPQRYRPVWPEEDELPKIVIAGCAGNEVESDWYHHGALKFTDADGSLELDCGAYADDGTGEGTVMFWTRKTEPKGADASALFSLVGRKENDEDTFDGLYVSMRDNGQLELRMTRDWWIPTTNKMAKSGLTYVVRKLTNTVERTLGPAVTSTKSTEWQHVAVVVSNGVASLVVDFKACPGGIKLPENFRALRNASEAYLGADEDGSQVAVGRQIAEFSSWYVALSPEEIREVARTDLGVGWSGPVSYYSFREDDLGAPDKDLGPWAMERVFGGVAYGEDIELVTPGPKLRGVVMFYDTGAEVYVQNDKEADGYNPNEEHAVRTTSEDGKRTVVWALRCDLNEEYSSRPAVFVEYRDGDSQRLQAFYVVATNEDYRSFTADPVTVGRRMDVLPPVSALDKPWSAKTWWSGDRFLYQDRYAALWPRCEGSGTLRLFYPNRADFNFPALATQPAVGTPVPWLACLDRGEAARKNPLEGTPFPYAVSAVWPDPETVAAMRIGKTLTKADGSLPEVWNQKSVAILYPDPTEASVDDTALLSDPTVWRSHVVKSRDLAAWGFSAGQGGNLTARGSKRLFRRLPPTISDRFWYDTESETLSLSGKLDENTGVLYPNVLAANEITELKAIGKTAEWRTFVDQFVSDQSLRKPVRPNSATWFRPGPDGATLKLRVDCTAADHYALTACGAVDWVVVAFNDATNLVDEGANVDLRVLRIDKAYEAGRAVALTDPNDLLSPKLSVVCPQSFGGRTDDYVFEWRCAPPTGGSYSEEYESYAFKARETGLSSLLLGAEGASLAELVNTYYVCRYQARPGTPAYRTMGGAWSDWAPPPALAEGWVQRCLNNITPFSQRMTDLYNNAAESAVSMLRQAGKAWAGDVALNQDNLNEVGLIELYQTLLNTAERMSLGLKTCDSEVAKQLLLAAGRLNDLYGVLGDEAYSDALNPTIGFGSTFAATTGTTTQYGTVDYSSAWSSLFCFDNQVQSLLDEELALLRGRSARTACLTAPNYNRLVWNFTKGMTAGEVAYAVNYAIGGHASSDSTASLTEIDAKAAYPQGHGDAYGHYLSALSFWYRLVRNPYFSWGAPVNGEMNVNSTALNVDYTEEAKFAESALKLAKAAERTLDLTARKSYRDSGGAALAGYVDEDADNGFGSGEWASRGGYGAFVNYLAASAQVPAATAGSATNAYADAGLKRIDRSTVTALDSLGAYVTKIQTTADRLDAGVNPLGLSENAVPFDISSSGAADGSSTHFDQIRARAGTAVENARRALDYAQTQSNRLRLISTLENGYADALETEEGAYTQQLIALFGKPFSEDIGPSGTYPTGYDGPDLYNYMQMDLSGFGFSATDDLRIVTNVVVSTLEYSYVNALDTYVFPYAKSTQVADALVYPIAACGLVAKNEKFKTARPVNGEIQVALADCLSAYAKAKAAVRAYDDSVEQASEVLKTLQDWFNVSRDHYNQKMASGRAAVDKSIEELRYNLASDKLQQTKSVTDNAVSWTLTWLGTNTGGVGTNSTLARFITNAGGLETVVWLGGMAADAGLCIGICRKMSQAQDAAVQSLNSQWDVTKLDLVDSRDTDYLHYYESMVASLSEVRSARTKVENAYADVQSAATRVSELVGQGNQLVEARAAARTRAVANISSLRYEDMLFRLLRNQALAKYDDAFALAQKYVYLAARAYDYETCLLTADAKSGKNFLAGIVGSRSLGQFADDGQPIIASEGDTGLAATLAQMDANWLVLKGQLGINNPQQYESTWFSLRRELFRIRDGAEGDEAWRTELAKHYVADFRTLPAYVRYCQPAQTSSNLAEKEPALVFEFASTIDYAKNFFGRDLADANDHSFDSTYYATKIRKAGVWFENYNEKKSGYTGVAKLASTPNVYLIPVGEDRMRAPGQEDGASLAWNVLDQVVPVPYAVGASQLGSGEWYPTYAGGDTGGADGAVRLRRHPSFRAYFGPGNPTANEIDMVRLVGRSVWNTRWLLIIPAGSLGTDRESALNCFINGTSGLSPVTDIKIGFSTYSNSGNFK